MLKNLLKVSSILHVFRRAGSKFVKVMIESFFLETQRALKDEVVVLAFNLHILKSHCGGVKEEVLYHEFSSNLLYLR